MIGPSLEEAQRKKPSYSAFLLNLLHGELADKRDRAVTEHIKNSGLDDYWMLDTFPWHVQTCLAKHRKDIFELAELDFLDQGKSVVFVGKAGSGKSGLASGILLKALYSGRTGRAMKLQELFDALGASIADRSIKRLLKTLGRLDLLVIEEFGYADSPNQHQINNFFRLMNWRCNRKSTIACTNLGFEEWPKFLGNGPLTAALVSRLLQKCHVVAFPVDAVNLRDPKWKLPATAPAPPHLNNPKGDKTNPPKST
jgi:DNA replication protein DnaC